MAQAFTNTKPNTLVSSTPVVASLLIYILGIKCSFPVNN